MRNIDSSDEIHFAESDEETFDVKEEGSSGDEFDKVFGGSNSKSANGSAEKKRDSSPVLDSDDSDMIVTKPPPGTGFPVK